MIDELKQYEYDIGYAKGRADVLDNIKADIFNACSDKYHMPVYKLDCDDIFTIIDKYRG